MPFSFGAQNVQTIMAVPLRPTGLVPSQNPLRQKPVMYFLATERVQSGSHVLHGHLRIHFGRARVGMAEHFLRGA